MRTGTFADVCRKACGKCKWGCTRVFGGNTFVNQYLDAAAPTLARDSSTCAALKNASLCGVVRKHGVCNRSCPQWPGGCQDVVGWADKLRGRTCSRVEHEIECSLATLDNKGPGWRGARSLKSLHNADGIGPYQACCQCGGGIYPEKGPLR